MFEPMLRRHGFRATGTTAAQIVAPNLDALEWDQVLEFRQHPGAQEARQMLDEWERTAVEQEPGEAAKTAVGFVPIVGPFIGAAVSLSEAAAERLYESRSGIAALMKLQQQWTARGLVPMGRWTSIIALRRQKC